jgi:hypothetical protein
MSWTLALAIYGAATGSIGTGLAILNRRDATWGRRSRALNLRTHLIYLRETMTEARVRPERAGALTTNLTFKGHVQALEDAEPVCPDRRLRKQLATVTRRSLNVGNVVPEDPSGPVPYALTAAIDRAIADINKAFDRLERIERRAPSGELPS